MNTQRQEQQIVGVVISCNNELQKLAKIINKTGNPVIAKILNKCDLYDYNFTQLFESVNDGIRIETKSIVPMFENKRNNYYAYLTNVSKYLNTTKQTNPSTLVSLNESIKSETSVDINSFGVDIKRLIKQLEKLDEPETITNPDIIKIKANLGKPIFVFGFDINNNQQLINELSVAGIAPDTVISIIYDKRNKSLLFVSTNSIVVEYSIISDTFANITPINFIFNNDTYLSDLKNILDNFNIFVLYYNFGLSGKSFTDNMFGDFKRYVENEQKKLIK